MSAEHPSFVQQLARRKAWVGAGALALVAIVGIALSGMALSDFEKTDDAFVEGAMSMLAAQVPGRVLEESAAQHQRVARGELLVRLDPADYAARVARARAELAAARNRVAQSAAAAAFQSITAPVGGPLRS